MKSLSLLLIFFLTCTIAFSQKNTLINRVDLSKLLDKKQVSEDYEDFLEPMESVLISDNFEIGYFIKLKNILFKGLPNNYDTRYLVRPSFQPEEVLLIYNKDIYYNVADKNIWKEFYIETSKKLETPLNYNAKISISHFKNTI